MAEKELLEFDVLTIEDRKTALIELCAAGLLTCTHGEPDSEGARYALAWERLNNPENFSEEVRMRHANNMRRLGFTQGASCPDLGKAGGTAAGAAGTD